MSLRKMKEPQDFLRLFSIAVEGFEPRPSRSVRARARSTSMFAGAGRISTGTKFESTKPHAAAAASPGLRSGGRSLDGFIR
jgi:hypothetical protein